MTKPHTALYMRLENKHFHEVCLPDDYQIQPYDVELNMNDRANIMQTSQTVCFACKQSINLFPDRREIILKQWPDPTVQTVEVAHVFANQAVGKSANFDGDDYTILHVWVIPPTADDIVQVPNAKGRIVALCELEEQEGEQSTTTGPLAKEQFTPGPWTIEHDGFAVVASNGFVAGVRRPIDARLIAEAPGMFALLKEYLAQHAMDVDFSTEEGCCADCVAARQILYRVVREEK